MDIFFSLCWLDTLRADTVQGYGKYVTPQAALRALSTKSIIDWAQTSEARRKGCCKYQNSLVYWTFEIMRNIVPCELDPTRVWVCMIEGKRLFPSIHDLACFVLSLCRGIVLVSISKHTWNEMNTPWTGPQYVTGLSLYTLFMFLDRVRTLELRENLCRPRYNMHTYTPGTSLD